LNFTDLEPEVGASYTLTFTRADYMLTPNIFRHAMFFQFHSS